MKTKTLKTLFMIALIAVVFMLVLGLSTKVEATVDEPERKIAGDFDQSFLDALYEKYGVNDDTFTWKWASEQTELKLSGAEISGIDKEGKNEHVLTGYFCNLKVLDVSDNKLGGLPNLPATLEELYCQDNEIKGLPVLSELTILNCSNNKLTALPGELGPALKTLKCAGNELTALPLMPDGLVTLDCSDNNIEWLGTPLPTHPDGTFPKTLVEINASNNKVKAIGALPQKLETLLLENNELTKFPTLPETLQVLNIKGNSGITSIAAEQLPEGLEIATDLKKGYDGNYYIESELPKEPSEQKPTTPPTSEETDNDLDEEPKTGITNYVVFASVIAIVALAGIVIVKSRK